VEDFRSKFDKKKCSRALANKIPKYPRRVSACGYLTALEILVNSDPNDYFATQIAAIGHRILIHNPHHYPDWSIQNMLTERGIINLIGVTPSVTYSVPSMADIEVDKRKCLFNNESTLHNFVHYNFHNCMVECRMNLTLKYCSCLPFYYHHESGTYPEARICNLRDIRCLTRHRGEHQDSSLPNRLKLLFADLIMSSTPGFDFSNDQAGPQVGFGEPRMHPVSARLRLCGPLGGGVVWNIHEEVLEQPAQFVVSWGVVNWRQVKHKCCSGGVVIQHQSVVRVYFNDLVATKNRRDVIFSWHTLLGKVVK
jgi:hypothetical protein